MSEPPAHLAARLHKNRAQPPKVTTDTLKPNTESPTAVPSVARNLGDLARAGKFLEIGRPNAMRSKKAQRKNEKDSTNKGDDGSVNENNWTPPPQDSFDPELTEYSDYAPKESGCNSDKHSCNSCLDVGSGDLHTTPGRTFCVWCASSGSCLERSHAFDLDRRSTMMAGKPPSPGTCRAGIATNPRHCGEVVDKIQKLFESQDDPLQLAAEEDLAKEMHFKVKVGWPQKGGWVGHSEPSDIGLDGFFRAEEGKPTLVDICYSLFGPSSSGKPLVKRCKSIRNPVLGNLTFPEPGPYTLSAWALDNVDDRFLSPLVTIAFDRLPSELYEEGCFATDPHAPGFPNLLEDSGLSTLMLASNRKLFGSHKSKNGATNAVADVADVADVDMNDAVDGVDGVDGADNAMEDVTDTYEEMSDTPLLYRPTGFEAGGSLQTTTSRMIHTMWWEGVSDLKTTSLAASRKQHGLDFNLQHLGAWSHSWTKYHSSQRWTYRVWDYVSMEQLFEDEFAGIFHGLYNRMTNKVDKMQLTKYMVLLRHGGVIVGPTMECLKPLDALVIQTGVVLSYEPHGKHLKESKISTDLMSSPPWHPLWWIVLHEIKRRVQINEREAIRMMNNNANNEKEKIKSTEETASFVDLTGVDMLTHAVHLYQELYPDTALKILNEPEDVLYGGRRVIVMDGGAKNDGCSMRGDCALTFSKSYAVKHYIESIESEQRLASTGSKEYKEDKEDVHDSSSKQEKREMAQAKAGKVKKEL